MKPAPPEIWRSAVAPHSEHSDTGSSDILWKTSNWCPFGQRYSYVGIW